MLWHDVLYEALGAVVKLVMTNQTCVQGKVLKVSQGLCHLLTGWDDDDDEDNGYTVVVRLDMVLSVAVSGPALDDVARRMDEKHLQACMEIE
jgi:hypothetical protein